jgi:hypothetical protein
MNSLRLLIAAAAISIALPSLHAVSDAAREFDQLTADHDKALTAAAEPINRRYQTALEALLRRATQSNDLDTAVRIKQALEKMTVKSPPAVTGTKAEVVGEWNVVNHTDGVTGVLEFKADNTSLWGGARVGVWEIKGKQLIVSYDNRGGHQDCYNLPVRDGKLEGTNTPGQSLTLTRKTQ